LNLDSSSVPGLRYAALVNPAGQIMDNYGQIDGDPTIAAILIQGAMSAAIDLGQRSGIGECQELALTYSGGGILASTTADGHVLLFQHALDTSPESLRQKAREILAELEEPAQSVAAPAASNSLMDALNVAQP
jgi:hypothetical protein